MSFHSRLSPSTCSWYLELPLFSVSQNRNVSLNPLTMLFSAMGSSYKVTEQAWWVKKYNQSLLSPILSLYIYSKDLNLALEPHAEKADLQDHRYFCITASERFLQSTESSILTTLGKFLGGSIEAWRYLHFLCLL